MLYKAKIKLRVDGHKFAVGDIVEHQKGKSKEGFSKEKIAEWLEKGYIYDAEAELRAGAIDSSDDEKLGKDSSGEGTPSEVGDGKTGQETENPDGKVK